MVRSKVLTKTISPSQLSAQNNKLSSLPLHALIACWLGMVFDGMDTNNFIMTLHPALADLLHTSSAAQIGAYGSAILAIFMVGWAVGACLFGILADKFGRTRTLIFSVLLYAVSTGLCAVAHSWTEMAFYRFLVGCGIGGELCIGGVMLAEIWKGKSRLYATGVLQTGFPCGILLLSAANLLIGQFGWRWLYLIGIAPAFLAIYIRTKLEDSDDAKKVRDYRNGLRAKAEKDLAAHEIEYLRSPLFELLNRSNIRKTLIVTAMATCVSIGAYAVLGWIPAWINQLTGSAAVQERSFALISQSLGFFLGAATAGLLISAIGRKWAFRIAFAGALVVCPLMFLTTKVFGTPLLIWTFFAGYFVMAPYSYLFIYVPELFETRLRATGFSFVIQSGRVFAGLVCLLSGQLVGVFGGSYAMAGASIASFYLLALLATFFMPTSPGVVKEELLPLNIERAPEIP